MHWQIPKKKQLGLIISLVPGFLARLVSPHARMCGVATLLAPGFLARQTSPILNLVFSRGRRYFFRKGERRNNNNTRTRCCCFFFPRLVLAFLVCSELRPRCPTDSPPGTPRHHGSHRSTDRSLDGASERASERAPTVRVTRTVRIHSRSVRFRARVGRREPREAPIF